MKVEVGREGGWGERAVKTLSGSARLLLFRVPTFNFENRGLIDGIVRFAFILWLVWESWRTNKNHHTNARVSWTPSHSVRHVTFERLHAVRPFISRNDPSLPSFIHNHKSVLDLTSRCRHAVVGPVSSEKPCLHPLFKLAKKTHDAVYPSPATFFCFITPTPPTFFFFSQWQHWLHQLWIVRPVAQWAAWKPRKKRDGHQGILPGSSNGDSCQAVCAKASHAKCRLSPLPLELCILSMMAFCWWCHNSP